MALPQNAKNYVSCGNFVFFGAMITFCPPLVLFPSSKQDACDYFETASSRVVTHFNPQLPSAA